MRKSKEQRVAGNMEILDMPWTTLCLFLECHLGDVANSLVESTITRFLHLLVHHPDYSSELDDLFMFSA